MQNTCTVAKGAGAFELAIVMLTITRDYKIFTDRRMGERISTSALH